MKSQYSPPPSDIYIYSSSCNNNQQQPPPAVRLYCQAKTDHSLTIYQGKVIIAPCNPSDPHQHWIKDEKFGIDIKDEQGYSSFALVNKATGQALKHAIGVNYPVQVTEYKPNVVDMSVLWSISKNEGGGYRAVRAVDNIHLNLTVRDGTDIVFGDWFKKDNQKWTMISYSSAVEWFVQDGV